MRGEEPTKQADDAQIEDVDNAIGESVPDSSVEQAPTGIAHTTREATLEDIERIDSLTLEDFAVDFGNVQLPDNGKLTEQELSTAVESFLSTLRER